MTFEMKTSDQSFSYVQNIESQIRPTKALKSIYFAFPFYNTNSQIMAELNNAKCKLEKEINLFTKSFPDLESNIFNLELKVNDFLKQLEPDNISISITNEKSVYMILRKDDFKILFEAYIENDNDNIEGLVTIYNNNKIALDNYGTHDFLFKEVRNIINQTGTKIIQN